MKHIVSKDSPPLGDYLGGTIFKWERGKDPFHIDAIPDEIKGAGIWETGKRKAGWFGLDWVGNQICFVADGTEEHID